jgi:transcriptional regulator with XRE-family HTH domain
MPIGVNLIVTGEQLRAARAMARIEQSELAGRAKVSVETIKRLERTSGPVSANVQTADSVVHALESAGVEFTNGGQPGVRLRKGAPDVQPDFAPGGVQTYVPSGPRRNTKVRR